MIILTYLTFLVLLLAVATIVTWLRVRRFRLQAIIQALALIVGQNVPLPAALRAAARFERRKLRRVFQEIAYRLEVGDTVSTALRTSHPSCPGEVVGAIQGAEQGGTLPSVLRSLATDVQRAKTSSARLLPAVVYFFVLLLVVPPILLSIGVFLVPRFKDILLDYGVAENPQLEQMVSVGTFVHENSLWFLLGALVLAILVLQLLLGRYFCPRVPDRFQWIPALFDTIVWHLPVLRRIAETRALTRQLPVLQAAIRAGHDIVPAARQAACVDANLYARRRMRRWAEQVERGAEPAAQARVLGFPRALRSALTTARGRDELAAGLDYLCSYYRSLLTHWEQLAASAAVPLVVLMWAACVAYVALAVFTPICAILDAIMAEIY